MAKSLTGLIDKLINDIGGCEKPTLGDIRSQLVTFRSLAETLENGQSAAEQKRLISDLQTQKEDRDRQLAAASAEIERFRAEQAEREKKDADMPAIQLQILRLLPSEHGGGWLRVDEISRAVKIPVDEAEIHLAKLKKAQLVIGRYNAWDAIVWHRTMPGNEYVLAQRLAGEEA